MFLESLATTNPLFPPRYGEDERTSGEGRTGVQLLVATFQHMRQPLQLLVIPLTVWSGVEQAFINADFTAVSIFYYFRFLL